MLSTYWRSYGGDGLEWNLDIWLFSFAELCLIYRYGLKL